MATIKLYDERNPIDVGASETILAVVEDMGESAEGIAARLDAIAGGIGGAVRAELVEIADNLHALGVLLPRMVGAQLAA